MWPIFANVKEEGKGIVLTPIYDAPYAEAKSRTVIIYIIVNKTVYYVRYEYHLKFYLYIMKRWEQILEMNHFIEPLKTNESNLYIGKTWASECKTIL